MSREKKSETHLESSKCQGGAELLPKGTLGTLPGAPGDSSLGLASVTSPKPSLSVLLGKVI